MPVHDWTKVKAGIFHHFHQAWILSIANALNYGVLPPDYYALAEQATGGPEPDVLTLKHSSSTDREDVGESGSGALALQAAPPRVHYHSRAEVDVYAAKADRVVIRHVGGDEVVAMLEVVSPGNKSSRKATREFLDKAEKSLTAGVHFSLIDLFPSDPYGLPALIWEQIAGDQLGELRGIKRSMGAFIGGRVAEAFIEPIEVGAELIDLPLFISSEHYVLVPLAKSYATAWETVPSLWRERLT